MLCLKELAELTNLVPGLGVDDKSIADTAKTLGFKVEIQNDSSFDDIEKWLEKGVPLIVDWFTRGRKDYDDSEVSDGHYSVVIGLDGGHIYLQDPEIGGERKIDREDFMKVWFDFTDHYLKPEELIIRQLIAIYK
jgi:predicted double-glycine peptidase